MQHVQAIMVAIDQYAEAATGKADVNHTADKEAPSVFTFKIDKSH